MNLRMSYLSAKCSIFVAMVLIMLAVQHACYAHDEELHEEISESVALSSSGLQAFLLEYFAFSGALSSVSH
jgi:hypothetical protein